MSGRLHFLKPISASLLLLSLLAACAGPGVPDREVASQLAPTGALRVGLNLGNTLLTRRDPAGGDPGGVAVDLARELGRRIGVPVRLVPYDNTGGLGSSIGSGAWDIAFFAIEPARATQVDFSPAYVEIDSTFIAMRRTPLATAAEVDREDVVVAVQAGAGYESTLIKSLSRAKLLRVTDMDRGTEALASGKAHVLAGLRPALITYTESHPDFRVLDGKFTTVGQAIGVQKGRQVGARYVNDFVDDVKRSGFLAKLIAAHNVRGLTIP
jgi:polar amino acid transport system substrate-binding protein